MPIQNFDGETFVAFLDICGFKEIMKTPGEAEKCLDRFFSTIYREADRSTRSANDSKTLTFTMEKLDRRVLFGLVCLLYIGTSLCMGTFALDYEKI